MTGVDWIDRALRQTLVLVDQSATELLSPPTDAPAMDIIVPVFEAHDELLACLEALRAHTDPKHRIWLLDDCSTDHRISRLGHSLAETDSRIKYYRQPRNLGYVTNVNHALSLTDRDVVLLNSDTRVTARWLERMWRCMESADRVGVVSPLSNNATLLSVTRSANPPVGEIDEIAEAVAATARPGPVAIPTAVGFCMMIRRRLLETIGLFDEAFSPGYGEEADFCMRAWSAGFRVLACTDAFVYHRGQASFGAQADRPWRRAHEQLLASRWPEYESIVRGWWRNNPLRGQIERLAARSREKPLVVHLLHRWNTLGGTEIVTRRLVDRLSDEFEHLLIVPGMGGSQWADATVRHISPGVELMVWNRDYLDDDWQLLGEPAALQNPWLDGLLARVLTASGADVVHVHHLLGWGTLMPPLIARAINIDVILSLHCFHYLCPDYNQIGPDRQPCGKRMVDTSDYCTDCLLPRLKTSSRNPREKLQQSLIARRTLVRQVIRHASRLTAPSQYLRDRMARAFGPTLSQRTELVPHGVETPPPQPPESGDRLIVSFLGGLKRLKGSRTVLAAAARLPADMPIEIRLYGPDGDSSHSTRKMPGNCIWKGAYRPEDSARIIASADLILVPSLFEETYSLALSEAWCGGRPVIASNRGALAERVREDVNGWLFPPDDDKALADLLAGLAAPEGRTALAAMHKRLVHQARKPGPDFTVPYRHIYRESCKPSAASRIPASRSPAFDIAPDRMQTILNRSRNKLQSWLASCTRVPNGRIDDAPRIAVWILAGEDDAPGDLQRTMEHLQKCDGIGEVICATLSDRAAAARADQLQASWIWLLHAAEQPLPASVAAIRTRLSQAGDDQLFCFDHLHYRSDHRLHGPVFKPPWDRWLAATGTDFDCGWIIARELLVTLLNRQQSLDHWPPAWLLKAGARPKPRQVPLPILARPDHVLDAAACEVRRRRHLIGLESGPPSHPLPPIVIIDTGKPSDLQATLDSLLQLPAARDQVVIQSDNPRRPPGDWPANWIWTGLQEPAPVKATEQLVLRSGIALTDVEAVRRHLPCLDEAGVAAIGFAIRTLAGAELGAGRIADHDQGRLLARPPWPGGARDASSVLRRVSALTFDITLLDTSLIASDSVHQRVCGDGSWAPEDNSLILLASSQVVAHCTNRPQPLRPFSLGKPDPFFSPRLGLTQTTWAADRAGLQASVVRGGGLQVVAITPDLWASSQYRLRQPLAALHERGDLRPPIIISLDQQPLPSMAEWERLKADVLVVHHCFDQRVLDMVEKVDPALRPRLIYLLDDLLTELPDYNPFNKRQRSGMAARLNQHLSAADLLIVSTRELARAFGDLDTPVRVIENALPDQPWGTLDPGVPAGTDERPRVGWAGAQQHEGDLRLLKSVIRTTSEYVDWVLFGMCPDYLRPWIHAVFPAVDFSDYPRTLRDTAVQVAVAPLVDNPFNRCKSALKLLEFGRLGIPVIASDLPPYRTAPIIRLDNSPQAWIDAIANYAAKPQQARSDGAKLKQWVLDNHRLAQRLDDWHDALAGAGRSMQRTARPVPN